MIKLNIINKTHISTYLHITKNEMKKTKREEISN